MTRRARQGAAGTRSAGKAVLRKYLGQGLKAPSYLLVLQGVEEEWPLKGKEGHVGKI